MTLDRYLDVHAFLRSRGATLDASAICAQAHLKRLATRIVDESRKGSRLPVLLAQLEVCPKAIGPELFEALLSRCVKDGNNVLAEQVWRMLC